jgi:hypothetical protein
MEATPTAKLSMGRAVFVQTLIGMSDLQEAQAIFCFALLAANSSGGENVAIVVGSCQCKKAVYLYDSRFSRGSTQSGCLGKGARAM